MSSLTTKLDANSEPVHNTKPIINVKRTPIFLIKIKYNGAIKDPMPCARPAIHS